MPLFGPPNIEKLESKADIEGLIKALAYTKDSAIPIAAAEAMGRLCRKGDTFPVRRLANQIHSQDPELRQAALLAVGQIGDSEATNDAVMALEQETDSRVWGAAVFALAQIGDEKALKTLDALFIANHPEQHKAAAAALDQFGWQPVHDRLSAWYWLAKEDLDALEDLGDIVMAPLSTRLFNRDPKVCSRAADIMVLLGDIAVAPLIKALDTADPYLRQQSARALGEIGDPRAVKPLLALLEDREAAVVAQAFSALVNLNDADAMEALAERMIKDPQMWQAGESYLAHLRPYIIQKALDFQAYHTETSQAAARQALICLGKTAVDPLISALSNPQNANIIPIIAQVLANIKDPRAVPSLIQVLEGIRTTDDQALPLIQSLGELGDVRAIPELTRFLQAPITGVQQAAVLALTRTGGPQAVQPLIGLLNQSEGDQETQLLVIKALGDLGHPTAIPAITPLLQATQPEVLQMAAHSLKRLGWSEKTTSPTQQQLGLPEKSNLTIHTAIRWLAAEDLQKQAIEYIISQGASAVPELIKALDSHTDPRILITSIQLLGSIGDLQAVQPLGQCLAADHRKEIQIAACKALGDIAHSSVISWLTECLQNNPDLDVKLTALQVVGALRPEEAVKILCKDWLTSEELQEEAAHFLKSQGRMAVPEVVKTLKMTQDPQVSLIGIKLLGEIGSAETIPVIKPFLYSQQIDILKEAVRSLKALGWTIQPEIISGLPADAAFTSTTALNWLSVKALRLPALSFLRSLGPQAVPELIETLHSSKETEIRIDCIQILGASRDSRAVQPLGRCLTTDPQIEIRMAACEAFESLDDPGAGYWLARCLVNDSNLSVKFAALQTAGKLCPDEAIEILCKYWLRTTSLQNKALSFLKSMGRKATPGLINALDQGDPKLHMLCIQLLGEIGDPQAVTALGNILVNADPYQLRLAACQALGSIGDPSAGPWLAACLQKETSHRVRTAALKAAGETNAAEALQPLQEWLEKKPDYETRIRICTAIGGINHPESGRLLVDCLHKDNSRKVRAAAMKALGMLGDPQTFDALFEPLLKGDKRSERRAAAKALIQLYLKAGSSLSEKQKKQFLQQKSWIEESHLDGFPPHTDKDTSWGACNGPTYRSHNDWGGTHRDTGIGLEFPF